MNAIQQTHWDGCWEERSHHQCALKLIAQLREARAAQPGQPSLTTKSAQISSGLVVEDGKGIEGAKENSRET